MLQYRLTCFRVSHSRFQLLLHFGVLLLRHGGFAFTQFVHLLPRALEIRLRGCWGDLETINQRYHLIFVFPFEFVS